MTTNYDFDYHTALQITENRCFKFYPCLIAAMQQADYINLVILKAAFPAVYESWQNNRKLALQCKLQDWQDDKKKTYCIEEE